MITHEPFIGLLTVSEAAAELRVSKPTIRRWIDAGRLRAVRLGPRTVRIRRADLRRLAQTRRSGQAMTLQELEPYIVSRGGDPSRSPSEVMASIAAIHERILARRGGRPLPSSLRLIHEARSERDERL